MAYLSENDMWEAVINNDSRFDGVFYYGVKTTGVFCRPSCKSKRPVRHNILFFDSVNQAMGKGFRPCKRCRPDLIYRHDDAAELIKKACKILETEYYHAQILLQLPQRLGISRSYFQRLFKKRTGHSPKVYLLNTRINKAGELLLNTNKTNLEICYEAGFRSISHFYAAFRRFAGVTPSSFRRQINEQKDRSCNVGVCGSQHTGITIEAPDEFNFRECLAFLNRDPNECLYTIEDGKVYKLLKLADQYVLFSVSSPRDNLISVEILDNSGKDGAAADALVHYLREWFDLATDLKPFYALAARDGLLKGLVQKYYGLRLIGIPDLFEALTWAIIGQQVNLSFAYSLKRRFVETYGEKFSCGDRVFWLFPTPKVVAELSVAALSKLQFTKNKAEYIIEVAKKMASGALTKEKLAKLNSLQKLEEALLSLRGVGKWTASYVSMKCFRQHSAFPVADVGLRNAIKHQLALREKPTPDLVSQLGEKWKGWEAYATFYLWRSLIK